MNLVTLGPDGSLTQSGEKEVADPLSCLGYGLSLARDTRLRHFFKMMEHYPLLGRLSNFLPDLLSQYRNGASSGCRCDDFDYLEFTKTIEMVGFPGDPRLELYTSLLGIAGDQTIAIRDFSLSLILDMEIRLGKLKHVVFGDTVDAFEFDTVFTLFEFIDGIVWELSFHSLPKECQLRR